MPTAPALSPVLERPPVRAAPALRVFPLGCIVCGVQYHPGATAVCERCLGPLEPVYPTNREIPDRDSIAGRSRSLWRYHEFLPFEGPAQLSLDTGLTPLVEAPALARKLGVARAWLKNDSVSHPTLSFKDRVVAAAINAARALGLETLACASTGNLANAVAAHAARAGLPAWVFIPHDLEPAKVIASAVYGARLVRVRGTYDDVNRLCTLAAERFKWGIVNVNLRSYYGEGSKTMAFEIAEQLGWRLPTAVIAPMAGGSLVTKLGKGFREFLEFGLVSGRTPRLFGTQASGCAPIVRLVQEKTEVLQPVIPQTIARSLAIGSPADGIFASRAIHESGGWAAAVSDDALSAGIRTLAETSGVFAETAGGVTVAGALALAASGHLRREDEVVLCITGNGLKTIDAVPDLLNDVPTILPKLRELSALVEHSV
ncbi:MAG TPA: threonine synthase [Gemmatimonadales bacterium]